MKKTFSLLLSAAFSLIAFAQQDTSSIGSGTSSSNSYGPVYRSSATSSFDYSRYHYLYTSAEMAAANIPAGSSILGVAWDKATTGAVDDLDTGFFKVYVANSSTSALSSTGDFSLLFASSTQVLDTYYDSSASNNLAGSGWKYFMFSAPFQYSGGSFDVLTDWNIGGGLSSSPTDGAINWYYESATDLTRGAAASSASGVNTYNSSSYRNNRPNVRIIFIPPPPIPLDIKSDGLAAISGCISSSTALDVTISNNGTDTINFATTNATVGAIVSGTLNQTFSVTLTSGSLTPGSSQLVSVTTSANLGAAGTYDIQAFASVMDLNVANDTSGIVSYNQDPTLSTPLIADFTTFSGSNLSSSDPGFSEASGATSPSGTSSSWTSSNATQNTALGSETARLNLYTTSRKEWILAGKIIPIATDVLSFNAAVTNWNSGATDAMGSDDSVNVMISTDCGISYQSVMSITAANQPSNALTKFSFPLAAYAGQPIIIGILAQDGPVDDSEDYDFHLDDITIETPSALDIKSDGLVPISGCMTANTVMDVLIFNNGADTIDFSMTNATVGTVVSGTISQTYSTSLTTGSLAPGATQSVTVTSNANLAAIGSYDVRAFASISDANPGNDTSATVSISQDTTYTSPLTTSFVGFSGSNLASSSPGFSEGSGAVVPSGTSSAWTSGNASQITALGSETARINLYTNTRAEWILTSKVVTGSTDVLTFSAAVTNWNSGAADAMGSDDSLKVLISTDCGSTFQLAMAIDNSNQPSNALTKFTVPLAAYAGQTIIVGFQATDGPVDDSEDYDLHITNISIAPPPVPLATPMRLRTNAVQDTTAVISWDVVPGALAYKVVVKPAGTASWTTVRFKHTNTGRMNLDGLTPGTKYAWSVMVKTQAGWSKLAKAVKFTTLLTPCLNPTTYSTAPIQAFKAKLNWSGAGNVFRYKLRYRQVGDTLWNIAFSKVRSHKWLTRLSDSTSYEWQVKTECQRGTSSGNSWSALQTFTTKPAPSPVASFRLANASAKNDLQFELYPNPTSNQFTLVLKDADKSHRLQISDLTGKLIKEIQINSNKELIDVSSLANGVYLVRYDSTVKRLIINK